MLSTGWMIAHFTWPRPRHPEGPGSGILVWIEPVLTVATALLSNHFTLSHKVQFRVHGRLLPATWRLSMMTVHPGPSGEPGYVSFLMAVEPGGDIAPDYEPPIGSLVEVLPFAEGD